MRYFLSASVQTWCWVRRTGGETAELPGPSYGSLGNSGGGRSPWDSSEPGKRSRSLHSRRSPGRAVKAGANQGYGRPLCAQRWAQMECEYRYISGCSWQKRPDQGPPHKANWGCRVHHLKQGLPLRSWLSSQEHPGPTTCAAVWGWCPLVLVDRGLKSWGYLCLGSEVPHPHPCSHIPFKSLVVNSPAQCGGWRVSPGAGSWVLPSQVPSLHSISGGRRCASPFKPGREMDTSFAWLKWNANDGRESVFIIHGLPPTGASSPAEPQVIPPHHCPESLQQPGPGSWVPRAPGLLAQPSCPPERALALVSLICPLVCSEVVGAPVRVKWRISFSEKWSLPLPSKRSLSVPRRTLQVRSLVHCPHRLHLWIAFTFWILTSLEGTGARPNTYFPGSLLQASTSVLMRVDKAVGQGWVCVEGRDGTWHWSCHL